MKIAFVYDVIYPYVKGGVEKRVWELARRLAARGHDVHIFGMKYWEGDDIRIQNGVFIHGVCPAKKLYSGGRRTIGEALYFGIHLAGPLAKEQFDIIDCQQFPYFPSLVAKITGTIKKTPLIITWHEVWGNYWYEYLGYKGVFGKIIERIVSRLTPNIIAVSETTAGQLRNLSPKSHPVVIPNGIDLDEINATHPSGKKFDLIFAGRLIREKHVDLLVEATALLIPQFPDLAVLIVGDGPERDRIRLLIQERGLEDHITLRSFCEDHQELIALIKSSKLFVIPSTREGFGIVALEALACGLPIVTVDNPANAIREIANGTTGFLCTLSGDDLAGSIRSGLQKYGTMREACIAAVQRFDWNQIADKAEEYYRSVIVT